MKIKLSKIQWKTIGRKAGWIKIANKVSNCCGASDGPATQDGPHWSDIGICPECKEHCEFVKEDEEGSKD